MQRRTLFVIFLCLALFLDEIHGKKRNKKKGHKHKRRGKKDNSIYSEAYTDKLINEKEFDDLFKPKKKGGNDYSIGGYENDYPDEDDVEEFVFDVEPPPTIQGLRWTHG